MTRVERVMIQTPGGPEVLQRSAATLAAPGPGEVVVRHEAIGLNFIDTYHRSGLYPLELPSGLGVEAAGVVQQRGAGVESVEEGDRVAYATAGPGAYASHRIVRADQLVPVPDGVSSELAAAVLLKGMTVEYLIRRLHRVQRGDAVLLHAAAGGVGLLACQWLRHLGARVLGTVSSREKAELARANGCDEAIVVDAATDIAARVRELMAGEGVGVVYDSVGKATFESSLRSLKRRGLLVSFGNASGKPDPLDVLALSRHGSLFVTRPTLADYVAERGELLACAEAVFSLVRQGVLRPFIGQRFALADAAEAHRQLEARQTRGSTLLLPD
jgi:NADPH2:quinone reductase